MILLIDNYDSFSYNLYQLVGSIEPDIRVVRNDALTPEQMLALSPDGIIISPGPGRPEDAGFCIEVVKQLGGSIPLLGVCPRASGHLRGFWRDRILRKTAHARQTIPNDAGHKQPAVLGMPGDG